MDTYQAVYDAVRSKISGGDIGSAVRDVIFQQFDISHSQAMVRDAFMCVASDMSVPSVLYKPAISIDGNKWCALYGANLQDGVAGFGDSPYEAMLDFNKNWCAKLGEKP